MIQRKDEIWRKLAAISACGDQVLAGYADDARAELERIWEDREWKATAAGLGESVIELEGRMRRVRRLCTRGGYDSKSLATAVLRVLSE